MRIFTVAALLLLAAPHTASAWQGQNPLNLWVADLTWTGNRLTVGTPVKLTNDNGSNSQPAFTPDGRAIVFSASRDTGAAALSDIYRMDLATRAETRVTQTPENENSPTVNERGEYVAVRWVPATLFKEFGIWKYAPDGTPTRGELPAPDTTGYYTPLGVPRSSAAPRTLGAGARCDPHGQRQRALCAHRQGPRVALGGELRSS